MEAARNSFDPCGVRPVLCSAVPGELDASAAVSAALKGVAASATGLDNWDRLLRSRLNLASYKHMHTHNVMGTAVAP